MKPSIFFLLTPLIFCAGAEAQIASDGSLPGKNKFDRVEINSKSPSDNEIRQRSLVAKRVYGGEEIERFGNGSLSDVLSSLPGVVLINGAPSLSGMDPKYTKILFNGDPAPAGVAMEQINPALIERIEISRLQTASKSSQGIGGTINIVFKDVPKKSTQTLRVGANYQNERPTPSVTYTTSGKVGDFSYSLPITLNEVLQTYQVNSLRSSIDENNNSSSAYQEKYWWYRFLSPSLAPKLEYTINDDEKLTSQSFIQSGTRTLRHRFDTIILAGNPGTEDDFDSKTTYSVFRTNIQWVKNLSSIDRIEAKAVFNSLIEAGISETSKLGTNLTTNDFKKLDTTQNYSLSYNHLLNDQHVITTGFDIDRKRQHETLVNYYQSVPINASTIGLPFFAAAETTAVYLQDEWEYSNQMAFNIGVRSESIRLISEVPGNLVSVSENGKSRSNSFTFLSPSIFLSFTPDPVKKNTIRAGLSRAYKSPDISSMGLNVLVNRNAPNTSKTNSEFLSDSAGNSTLRPELATNVDLTYEMYLNSTAFVSVGGFYRDITDIVADVTTLQQVYWATAPRWVSQPYNYSHGISYGLEIEVKASASDLLPNVLIPKRPLNLRANLNIYGSRIDALPGPDNRLPSQYPWTATLGFDYKPTDSLTIGANAFISPEFNRQVTATQVRRQSNLDWVNAFASYKIDNSSSMRFGINNLFPSTNRYEDSSKTGQALYNRSGRTGISVSFDTKL